MPILEEQFHRLAPEAKKYMLLTSAIFSGVMILTALASWLILQRVVVALPAWVNLVCFAWIGLWLLYSIIVPLIRYRRYRYLIDEEKVVVKEGIWFITQEFAPIERIHQVTVKSGPIDRLFGLANVIVTTAGGTVAVRFLQAHLAEEIADTLQAKVRYLLAQQGISLAGMTSEANAADEQDIGDL